MLIALNKPMNTLSQFTSEGGWPGLSGLGLPKGVYAAGRLDRDSEGLLLLTDDGRLQARIASPGGKVAKTYLAQVEGAPDPAAMARLREGIVLKDGPAAALAARAVPPPGWLWPRDPPVRRRKSVPDHWIEIALAEGRNRQVRRMTAHVGLPCLRLVRVSIGGWELGALRPGEWREIAP
ncbi:MAG: pseudouridine synthase [Hasllibacter sp.]